MTDKLTQLVYISTATRMLSDSKLTDMLITFRRNNKKHKVTGVLVHYKDSFIQAIEGPQEAIDELWKNLIDDHRHKLVTRVLYRSINKRMFNDWSMAFEKFENESEVYIDGFCEVFKLDQVFTEESEKDVENVVKAFSEML